MKTKLLILLFLASLFTYAQTNLVPNGGFENWSSSSQPSNWYRYFSGLVSQSNSAQNGTSSTNMKITDGTFNYINSEFFPVVANKTYRITLYHKLVSGSFSAIDLSLYNKPGTFKAEIIKKTDATFSSTEWRKIEFDYTPTVSENIEVDIWATGTLNSEILVDNVSVIDVAELNQVYTLIPDVNFEKKLIALGIDSGATDGKVLTSKINKLTSLNVSSSSISDLTGIQDFDALKTLNCGSNLLTTFDVSKNVVLENLICYSNPLTAVDVTKNTALKSLNVSLYPDNTSSSNTGGGKIESLDLSKNLALTDLNCSYNRITSLNLSNNTLLTNLKCVGTFLSNIDVTKNVALKSLSIAFYENVFSTIKKGYFESIDLSKNIALESLDCSFNKIIDLDISNNIALKSLKCSNNLLTKLDISKNSSLSSINCYNNQLTSLDTSNNLNLYELKCHNNQLTVLDFSKNTKLNYLWCADNKLNSLDVTKNISLIDLYCGNNPISNLNVTNNLELARLSCYSNNLATLDVSKYLKLQTLECDQNNLKTLDVTKNPALEYLRCSSNQLTTLDISKNALLYELSFGNNQLTAIDFSNNPKLFSIICNNNLLTSLDISNSKSILYVNCNSNKLTYLNLKNGNTLYVSLGLPNYKNNPDLKCIQVSNIAHAKQNWSSLKDATARFSEDCGAPLELPSNNFTVESKGETCTGSNNGELSIVAKEIFSYTASINGKSYPFTDNNLKINNLSPGTYTISITIPGEIFEQNFTVTISKGATITGKSSVESNKVAVEISEGTAPYTVFVDGVEQFVTNDSSFSVETKKGGLLQVTTAKACEGTYTQDIAGLEGAVSAYPNPTSGSFEIEIPTARKKVTISLYTLDGHLISNKTYTIENGKAQLSLENQASGVYVVKIELDTPNYLKIIKN